MRLEVHDEVLPGGVDLEVGGVTVGCQLLRDDDTCEEEDVVASSLFDRNTIVGSGGGKQFCTKEDF